MKSSSVIFVVAGAVLLALATINFSPDMRVAQTNSETITAFELWAEKFEIKFGTPDEKNHRLAVFAKNYKLINEVNNRQSRYQLGLNKFSGMNIDEFIGKFTGFKGLSTDERHVVRSELRSLPTSVDWRDHGAVNPVKNQGGCGSCWAFSATSAIEGAWQISKNSLLDLSEQQMVDCSWLQGNQGCNGGWMSNAFKYIQKAGGQQINADYPYAAVDGLCKFKSAKIVAKITTHNDIAKNDCDSLLQYTSQGPVSVAIAVTDSVMQYKSGVYDDVSCGTGLNHAVTLIGYGTDSTTSQNFYLVRNSWGDKWGEAGNIRMDRSKMPTTGICGICMVASQPVV